MLIFTDSKQRVKPIRKRRFRKQTPAMRREVAANVPKRSKTKSMNPAENGVDDKIKGQIRHDPSEGLQQRETEHDEWSKFSQYLSVNGIRRVLTLWQRECSLPRGY